MMAGISVRIPTFQNPTMDAPTPDSEEKRHQHGFYVRKHHTRYFTELG